MSAPFKTAKHEAKMLVNKPKALSQLQQACQMPSTKQMRPFLDVHDKLLKIGFSKQAPRPQLEKPPPRSGKILVYQYE